MPHCPEEGSVALPTLEGSLGLLLPQVRIPSPVARGRPSFCRGLPLQSGVSPLHTSEPPERLSVPQAPSSRKPSFPAQTSLTG